MTQFLLEPGSFRDRNGRIFYRDGEVYRTLSERALQEWRKLKETRFYREFERRGSIVPTREVEEPAPEDLGPQWAGLLHHERIPFVSYPYEWSFGMLRDAALLQLDLILAGLDEDLIPKDATAYNLQWRGAQPVFIDLASFETLAEGEPWAGYRQFCNLFLYPLLLQAYRDVPFHPWLRGNVDGIDAAWCWAMMGWRDLVRPGVFPHVYLQAKLQQRYGAGRQDVKTQLKRAGFHKDLIRTNAGKLRRTIAGLSWEPPGSTWSEYAAENTYGREDQERKARFVESAAESSQPELVWDLGCNTGVFSQVAARHAGYVVSIDGDHLAVERFYRRLKEEGDRRVLPLVANLADPSPGLGWRGRERKSLEDRRRPDLILALALIHHMVIGANIPVNEFVGWLRHLGASLVIEFVTKADPMVQTLLRNKPDQYEDYQQDYFEKCLGEAYEVVKREELQGGTRTIYLARPAGRQA